MFLLLLIVGLAAAAVVIGLLLVVIATRPAAFRIERSAVIAAPAALVFPLIDDFHNWALWSPFEKLDTNMKKTFAGPPAGVGAIYSWDGNSRAGAGRSTILESKPPELVALQLEMFRPFAAVNQVRFILVPAEGGTRVSWIMEGKNNFMGKAFSLLMNMDKMVGKEFEEGLINMGNVARARLQPAK